VNIDQFIREREPNWLRLEELLRLVANAPESGLGHERIRELVTLYRQVCSDLNHARSFTANPELIGRLNQLTGRAYRFIYSGGRKVPIRRTFGQFLRDDVPATFQRQWKWMAASFAAFAAGALFGFMAVIANPANGEVFIPQQFFAESPRERVEHIEKGNERIADAQSALSFGAFLYTHNIQVSFLAFSLGALTIAGGLVILFYNGVILGAVAAMYYLDGVEVFFLAWVGPHGSLELPSILFAGAAGLMMGRALLLPGNLSRESSLRRAFPDVWRILAAVAMILVMAGMIEGSFSQFSVKTVAYSVKIGVAVVLFFALMMYLFMRRERKA